MRENPSPLDRFRAGVMAQPSLQSELGAIAEDDLFVAHARGTADALGIALAREAVEAAIRPEPVGLARWLAPPHSGPKLPEREWLPVHVAAAGNGVFVDWAHFGNDDLGTPFFEDAIRQALRRPFNRMFRYRMAIGDVVAGMQAEPPPDPSGLIFHMSRCGSTLVHRMLGGLPRTLAISEPAPLDAIVTLCRSSNASIAQQVPVLRAMVAALGRRREGPEGRHFLKVDSWHTLALPLFRAAFPGVPWIFLYRDPSEVLASQLRQRGLQTVPEPRSAALYGIANYDGMASEEYCARVLAAVCRAALEHIRAPEAMLVDYAELPGAVCERILPHFGIEAAEGERLGLLERARYDAKTPSLEYASSADGTAMALRGLAGQHIGDINREFVRARAAR